MKMKDWQYHYNQAELCLEDAERGVTRMPQREYLVARAQVHATLAQMLVPSEEEKRQHHEAAMVPLLNFGGSDA